MVDVLVAPFLYLLPYYKRQMIILLMMDILLLQEGEITCQTRKSTTYDFGHVQEMA